MRKHQHWHLDPMAPDWLSEDAIRSYEQSLTLSMGAQSTNQWPWRMPVCFQHYISVYDRTQSRECSCYARLLLWTLVERHTCPRILWIVVDMCKANVPSSCALNQGLQVIFVVASIHRRWSDSRNDHKLLCVFDNWYVSIFLSWPAAGCHQHLDQCAVLNGHGPRGS